MILALSPHLDDVAFSIGGYLHERAAKTGEAVTCVTIFTGSIPHPAGFALACQLDKGLDADVDYMALRRAEDREACRILGIECKHLRFLEAPHRGYDSAPDLFAGIKDTDSLKIEDIYRRLRSIIEGAGGVSEILFPRGAGDHVDHQQVILVAELLRRDTAAEFRQYYDMPYARKHANRYPELKHDVPAIALAPDTLAVKVAACAAYRTQVAFQFGGPGKIADVLGNNEYIR